MNKPITFAIAGFGDRGSIYASMQNTWPDRMKVVAVADIRPGRVEMAKRLYNIPDEMCFASAEEMLAQEKLADVMVVSTMDRQHVGHAIPALEKGYHVLMEKPVSPDLSECHRIIEVAKRHPGQRIVIGHVLRYTVFFNILKSIVDSGRIGQVVSVCANENVAYWHQAHSFVRGNWRNSVETSPMILQKCCHDMDIYPWLLGKTCTAVSSVGSTTLFKPERAPEGAAERCLECPVQKTCKFDAEKIYITDPTTGVRSGSSWLAGVACGGDPTEEKTYEALRTGQYGRCVYHCDNDVVDHQQLLMQFADGSTMNFTMCAFTEKCYRYFKAMGTKGEIDADTLTNKIHVRVFGEGEEVIDTALIANDLKGHGGGDSGIVADLLDILEGKEENTARTATLQSALESHFICFAAEESRVNGGKLVDLAEFRK